MDLLISGSVYRPGDCCLRVAYYSYLLGKPIGRGYVFAAGGGLLHDLTVKPPRYLNSLVVCLADTFIALRELVL